MPISSLKRWRNGEIFSARDYVYERDTIISEVNRLSSLLGNTTNTAVVFTETTPSGQQNGDLWFDGTY